MKKTVSSILLTFLVLNVFAGKGNTVKLLSDSPIEGVIMEIIEDTEASVYVFESGSQAIGYKYFVRAEINNDYGIGVEANGETCFSGSKKTIFKDHVILKIDGAARPKVYWDVESGVLKIYVTK